MADNQEVIDWINGKAAKWTIVGWFAGLSWLWWSGEQPGISMIWWAVLVVVGMFASSILIGGGVSLLVALLSKAATGKSDGLPQMFSLGVLLSPILAFFAAMVIGRLIG